MYEMYTIYNLQCSKSYFAIFSLQSAIFIYYVLLLLYYGFTPCYSVLLIVSDCFSTFLLAALPIICIFLEAPIFLGCVAGKRFWHLTRIQKYFLFHPLRTRLSFHLQGSR